MSYKNYRQYTDLRGLNLTANNGCLRFTTPDTTPTTTSGERLLYVNSSNQLIFDDGSSATTLGSAGSVANFSLNDAYDDGNSITIDSSAVLLAGSHATNNVVEITASAAVTGACLLITNSGSGMDITANSSAWNISTVGGVAVVELGSTGTINATDGALTIGKTATATTFAGTVTVNEASTLTGAVTATASITITGTADTNVLTVTAGDIVVSNGKITLTNDDTDSAITVTANSVTTGNVITATANGITTGSMLYLAMTEAGITSGNGSYIECYDSTAGATQFAVYDNGATTITGNAAGTAALTLTAGDITISDGGISLTSTLTTDVVSITDNSLLANNAVIVKGSGTFTGATTSSFVAITPTGMTTGTALYVAGAAATTLSTLVDFTTSTTTGTALRLTTSGVQTGVGSALEIVADSATTPGAAAGEGVVKVSADGLTTGTALDVTITSPNALTSGRLADFSHVSGNITGTLNKSAQLFNVEATRTVTTGTVADDYDMGSFVRTSVINGGGTFSATGSVVYIENAVTNTSGTVSDTTKGIEVVMDSLGTGDGVEITHAATGGIALNVIGAATTVDDVLIACTGVKANNKASLQVTNSGATAAGGSILRVINTGTPAAATSYLVDFDYSGATMTNNPVAVFIDAGATTAAGLQVTGSGAMAGGNIEINSTATGALGAVLKLDQTANSAAASDVIGRVLFTGQDDANAAETYGRIDCIIRDTAAANPDASLNFLVDRAGTATLALTVGWDTVGSAAVNGILVGDGSGAGYISSQGAQNLTIATNGGTNSGTITITQGANAAITLTPNGSGAIDLAGKILHSETTTSSGPGAVAVTGSIHEITTTGADALTLADGTEGQILHVVMVTDGGDGTLTPTNLAGTPTTITFNDAGDAVTLLFTNATWYIVGQYGVTVA